MRPAVEGPTLSRGVLSQQPGFEKRKTASLTNSGVSSTVSPHPLFFQFLADIYNLESHKNEYR